MARRRGRQEPLSSNPAQAEPPRGPGPKRPYGPGPERPDGPAAEGPHGPGPERPYGPGPERPYGPGPERRYGPGPERPAGGRIAERRPGMGSGLGSLGRPNSIVRQFNFWDDRYEGRRLFAELLGTFFLVLVAAGAGMVNARFGGQAVPAAARVVAPALMVMAIILFMGTVSGAHLNPVVSAAFALRGDFPWRRVPAYVVAQFIGGVLATLLLWALIGRHGSAGLTLPGPGIPVPVAMVWELVLTTGLVSVILGTASGAQQVGAFAAIAVGSYIALAGLWGAPVSGASMNPVRSLGPALVLGDWHAWWAYLVGPAAGAALAVGIAQILRGPGGGKHSQQAAQGTIGLKWRPGFWDQRAAAPPSGQPPVTQPQAPPTAGPPAAGPPGCGAPGCRAPGCRAPGCGAPSHGTHGHGTHGHGTHGHGTHGRGALGGSSRAGTWLALRTPAPGPTAHCRTCRAWQAEPRPTGAPPGGPPARPFRGAAMRGSARRQPGLIRSRC